MKSPGDFLDMARIDPGGGARPLGSQRLIPKNGKKKKKNGMRCAAATNPSHQSMLPWDPFGSLLEHPNHPSSPWLAWNLLVSPAEGSGFSQGALRTANGPPPPPNRKKKKRRTSHEASPGSWLLPGRWCFSSFFY